MAVLQAARVVLAGVVVACGNQSARLRPAWWVQVGVGVGEAETRGQSLEMRCKGVPAACC